MEQTQKKRVRKKPVATFFYRIEPMKVLSALAFIKPEKQGEWCMQFWHDLHVGDPVLADSDVAANIIMETNDFRKGRSVAGNTGAKKRWGIPEDDSYIL